MADRKRQRVEHWLDHQYAHHPTDVLHFESVLSTVDADDILSDLADKTQQLDVTAASSSMSELLCEYSDFADSFDESTAPMKWSPIPPAAQPGPRRTPSPMDAMPSTSEADCHPPSPARHGVAMDVDSPNYENWDSAEWTFALARRRLARRRSAERRLEQSTAQYRAIVSSTSARDADDEWEEEAGPSTRYLNL